MKKLGAVSALVLLCAVLLPLFALPAAAGGTVGSDEYDYSRRGSVHNTTLDSAELLSLIINESLSDTESDYLRRFGDISLSYHQGITTEGITVERDGDTVRVTAEPYRYTADCGTLIEWLPELLSLGGEVCPFTLGPDGYTASAEFAGAENERARITYKLSLTVSAESVNRLLNMASTDASALKDRIEREEREYLELRARYDSDLEAFLSYDGAMAEYEARLLLYRDYASKKRIYDEALAEYESYLSALSEYEAALESHEQYGEALERYTAAYAEYRDYLVAVEEYNSRYERYAEYLSRLEHARAQLAIIDAAKVKMTDYRDLYSAIKSGIVSSVIENKDLITSELVNVDGAVVDAAGASTSKLRELLDSYFALTDEDEKYTYYTVNYEAFRDSFTTLLRSLDKLYSNKRIRAELIRQQRDKKYIILVAQLYITARALNEGEIYTLDGVPFNESYRIENKTPLEILEGKTYIDGGIDPIPLPEGYPAPVTRPELPEHMDEPIKPVLVPIPALPEAVEHPGEPPYPVISRPTPPVWVAHPGKAPEPPTVSDEERALIAALDAGELPKRDGVHGDTVIVIRKDVEKSVYATENVCVRFIGALGEELYSTSVERGTLADYIGPLPERAEDGSASYAFVGWRDGAGNEPDLSSVEGDLTLYAAFTPTPKYYKVSFNVLGEVTEELLPYGAMPEYSGASAVKPTDKTCEYSFVGWDKELSAVTADVIYTAVFEGAYILPYTDGSGGAEVDLTDTAVIADCRLGFARGFDLARIAARAALDELCRPLILKTNFGDISLSYSALLSIHESGASRLDALAARSGAGYTYRITLTDASGVEHTGTRVSLVAPVSLTDAEHAVLSYRTPSGDESYARFSLGEAELSFTAIAGYTYTLRELYSVSVIPSSLVGIKVSGDSCTAGTKILLTLDVPLGVEVDKIYYINSLGEETVLEGDVFEMPRGDITLGVIARRTEYKVTFVNGGRVIAVHTYYYGEMPRPPKSPGKASDELCSYEFIGWRGEIKPVTADVIYTARYRAELLPAPEEPEGIQISDRILRLIIIAAVAAVLLLAALVTVVTVVTVRLVRRRGRRRAKGAKWAEKSP
ncbi:MAG: hypothetical protein IKA64_06475 [Clostridia bacterium]|nr:hypothetical protein [Clostridia bacterium]